MKLNYIESKKSFHEYRDTGRHPKGIDVLHYIVTCGAGVEAAKTLSQRENYNPKELDVRLIVNGVEFDLMKACESLSEYVK